jgi:glycosyltransferase involved in cell wall biosynthesis
MHASERIPVAVVVMTKNEERNVERCLRSVTRFAQVFVVDSESTDRTAEIAESLGASVVQFHWDGGYPKKKQWCLEHLPFAHDWVLYLDADEVLPDELAGEIAALLESGPRHAGYFAGYDYVFLGRTLRRGQRVRKLVLFDRSRGRFVDYPDLEAANMWEVEGHYQPLLDGTTGVLRARILHADHDSLYHYFERHNRYSDWEAVVRENGAIGSAEAQPGSRATLKRVFARLPLKGAAAFVDSYLLKGGFTEGRAGFHFALARGFYYWQVGVKSRERELGAQREKP